MSTGNLLPRLAAYGADVAGTMERFLDDEQLYYKCLLLFIEDVNFAALEQALEAGEEQRAFAAAHTLKGVAGNLGLTPFYLAICQLVEALRAHDPSHLPQLHAEVLNQLAVARQLISDE